MNLYKTGETTLAKEAIKLLQQNNLAANQATSPQS
jgi:hypothetical protein